MAGDFVEQQAGDPVDQPPYGSLEHAVSTIGPAFDPVMYAAEYPDVPGDAGALLRHYCETGWREGRNANRGFDTVAYLHANPDVAAAGINPFVHFLIHGEADRRQAVPAFLPSQAAIAVLGHDPGPWVALVRPLLDAGAYAALLPPADAAVDPAAHYAFRGWLEGLDPSASFSTDAALDDVPELRAQRLNPLVHAVATGTFAAPGPDPGPEIMPEQPPVFEADAATDPALPVTVELPRFGAGFLDRTAPERDALRAILAARRAADTPDPAAYADPFEQVVAEELDGTFYRVANADVTAHGLDPVVHYNRHGWHEGRNPAPWFHSRYYLDHNPDVAGTGVNPFWHFLTSGRLEGRAPRQAISYRRAVIEQSVDPDARTDQYALPTLDAAMPRTVLEARLRAVCAGSAGLVLSVGHDHYVDVTGGVQLYIADEQAGLAAAGIAYLNISPSRPLLRLADAGDPAMPLRLILDGEAIGSSTYEDLRWVLERLPPQPDHRRGMVVHCVLGHQPDALAELATALGSTTNVFRTHDYSALCPGFTLMRNDVAFCGAPPPDSMTCRVCVYGQRRPRHLQAMERLFAAVPFQVVGTSDAALGIWRDGSSFAVAGYSVSPNAVLEDTGAPAAPPGDPGRGTPDDPVRLGFIGYPRTHKGWPIWSELMERVAGLGAYSFTHFGNASANPGISGLSHVEVSTSPGDRDAMARAIAAAGTDLVLMLSVWPETFSFATFEAMAGGADVVCLRDSGNIAAAVRAHRRGAVVADEAALFAFFESLEAVSYVRARRADPAPPAAVKHASPVPAMGAGA